MKNLVSTVIVSMLYLGSVLRPATAVAAVEVTASGSQAVAMEQVGLHQVTELGGAHALWVLGGGLVAVSLVARRRPSPAALEPVSPPPADHGQ